MVSNHELFKPTLLTLLVFCLSIFLQVTASPLAVTSLKPQDLVKRYEGTPSGKQKPGGPDTSDYNTDAEIAAAFTAPPGPFVFFSGIGDSQAPYNFAQTLSPAGAILRNTFTNGFITKGKPQRSEQWFQDFLDRASGHFADQAVKAGKPVYFVGKFNGDVNSCSIWLRIELRTLAAAGIQITLVDYTNFANQKAYPAPVIDRRTQSGGLEKRAQDYCFDWQGDREDPADPNSTPGVGLDYYPGWCVAHVVQYQKNEGTPDSTGGTTNYRFDIKIHDDQDELVGELDYADAPTGQGIDVDSGLPAVLILTAGSEDSDPVQFAYNGATWDSKSAQCSVGKYDSGSRNMDCGFTC